MKFKDDNGNIYDNQLKMQFHNFINKTFKSKSNIPVSTQVVNTNDRSQDYDHDEAKENTEVPMDEFFEDLEELEKDISEPEPEDELHKLAQSLKHYNAIYSIDNLYEVIARIDMSGNTKEKVINITKAIKIGRGLDPVIDESDDLLDSVTTAVKVTHPECCVSTAKIPSDNNINNQEVIGNDGSIIDNMVTNDNNSSITDNDADNIDDVRSVQVSNEPGSREQVESDLKDYEKMTATDAGPTIDSINKLESIANDIIKNTKSTAGKSSDIIDNISENLSGIILDTTKKDYGKNFIDAGINKNTKMEDN